MAKQNSMTLSQLKTTIQKRDESRVATIEQGGRAYRMGIEKRNCPLKEEGLRALWTIGWEKAESNFRQMFPGRGGAM